MVVTSVIKIEQFKPDVKNGFVRDRLFTTAAKGDIQESQFTTPGEFLFTHISHLSQPVAKGAVSRGWGTEDPEDWSDSPTRQPFLLYRHRFSWGRDREELFTSLQQGDPGSRWGRLDIYSGPLIYERSFPLQGVGHVRQFRLDYSGFTRDRNTSFTSDFNDLREIGGFSGDVTVEEFPFVITALPEPFSLKNPVNTNVFIRLGNFANPISSGTINLYLDDIVRTISISEFFGGLGGFDVTWTNDTLFDYDAQVDVKVQFSDTANPVNNFEIKYPFFTVPDFAPPRVLNLIPADRSTGVLVTGPIQFDIVDFENGVDILSLILYVNNKKIVNGENGTVETIALSNETGFTVKFTPAEAWLYGDLIPVALFVKDNSVNKNEAFFAYSFITEESDPPRLINLAPSPCTVAVPVDIDISADVIDGGHGLDKSTIVFAVDEIPRTNIKLIPVVHRDN